MNVTRMITDRIMLAVQIVKINKTNCPPPLVHTEEQDSWFEGIPGCGIQCENPIFTKEEHDRIHRFIGAFGTLSILCTAFTVVSFLVLTIFQFNLTLRFNGYIYNQYFNENSFYMQLTFLVGWKTQNKYPSVILFYMNACFCLTFLGFLIQFFGNSRTSILCKQDDTMRLGEPT